MSAFSNNVASGKSDIKINGLFLIANKYLVPFCEEETYMLPVKINYSSTNWRFPEPGTYALDWYLEHQIETLHKFDFCLNNPVELCSKILTPLKKENWSECCSVFVLLKLFHFFLFSSLLFWGMPGIVFYGNYWIRSMFRKALNTWLKKKKKQVFSLKSMGLLLKLKSSICLSISWPGSAIHTQMD